VIHARGIALRRSGRQLIHSLDLRLVPGELVVLIGPSGAGKSTLLKLFAGITPTDEGAVSIDGQEISEIPGPKLARELGLVPQDDIIHTRLSVEQALQFAARLRLPPGTPSDEVDASVSKVMAMTDLLERRSVRIARLSGGQRKRVSLGVELLCSPRFLFLDEPTSGLDPALEEKAMRLFQQLARSGHGLLVSTHALSSLELADQLLILMDGRLIFFGPPKQALRHFGVAHPIEIFKKLPSSSAADWSLQYRSSALARIATEPEARRRAPGPRPAASRSQPLSQPAISRSQPLSQPAVPEREPAADPVEALLAELKDELAAEEGNRG